jgi:glyoxylase-like metal-dependent hydrolase (beta-lactamase superfamily II)
MEEPVVENVLENIYRIEIPLPDNPLKTLNSYLILGKDRNLLIDTGFNRQECLDVLKHSLRELDVDLEHTDIFVTHLHADHSGLVPRLVRKNTAVYCSESDAKIINLSNAEKYWHDMESKFKQHGLNVAGEDSNTRTHPGWIFRPGTDINFTYVNDGDVIDVGEYSFKTIHTPGHTPGHMCLYDEEKEILFSGDHILGDITPVITIELNHENPLTQYLKSLKVIKSLPIKHIFTAHRRRIHDAYKRIEELEDHHSRRLDQVIGILESGPKNAYETAQEMTWKISCKSWSEFPPQQKWFATGEAMAHLLHLWEKKMLARDLVDGVYTFSLP